MRYLLVILLVVIAGCASKPTIVVGDAQVAVAASAAAEKSIDALEDNIPPIYLSRCLWMLQLEDDSMEELNYVMKTNAERFRECYLIHNSLVDILER